MIFCVDTSAFCRGAEGREYDMTLNAYARIWETFDRLAKEDCLKVHEVVFKELSDKDDNVYKWVQDRKDLIKVSFSQEMTDFARNNLFKEFPELAKESAIRSAADAWVIATAKVLKYTVVSEEHRDPKGNRSKNPKIPDICDFYGIRCENITGMMKIVQNESYYIISIDVR